MHVGGGRRSGAGRAWSGAGRAWSGAWRAAALGSLGSLGSLGALLALVGCAADPAAGDGGPSDGASICRVDADCDDGVFCNGAERCEPLDPRAAASGCVAASAPACGSGTDCDEAANRCDAIACTDPDRDGDGFDAVECGGDDCDDGDPGRNPGEAEVCDRFAVDEDCEASTFGEVDLDGDGAFDAYCCNGTGDARICGDDCDDRQANVSPSTADTCNGVDDDCDEAIDEGGTMRFHPDCDGDDYGPTGSTPVMGCAEPAAPPAECAGSASAGWAPQDRDCDDAAAGANPAATEVCNGIDDDCDASVDESVMQTYYADADGDGYGSSAAGAATTSACAAPSGFAASSDDCDDRAGVGAPIHPGAVELCDAGSVDEDCDGMTNEGCLCAVAGATRPCCSGRGTQTCLMRAPEGADWSTCSVGASTEICNGIDDDCDGAADESPTSLCSVTGQTCSGGACACPSGQAPCGGSCQSVGGACDGGDLDACIEGALYCTPGGTIACSEDGSDSGTTLPQCNTDPDCDGNRYENVTCNPTTGAALPCAVCGGGSYGAFDGGYRTCTGACSWHPTCVRNSPVIGIDAPPAWSPWVLSGACGGTVGGGRDYNVPYTTTGGVHCTVATASGIVLPPGRYYVTFDHYDSSVLVTPAVDFYVSGGSPSSTRIRNSIAGWQGHEFSFTVGSCTVSTLTITAISSYYDGSSGGAAGYYRGGDTIGNIRIRGPY